MVAPKFYSTEKQAEKAILVAVELKLTKQDKTDEYLDELELLALTAGAEVLGRLTQKLDKIDPKTYIGPGKMTELNHMVRDLKADMVIFDDELSPSQLRNIEKELPEIKVLDRSNLILDIFAKNAKTAQAKTQVEMAQNQYLLPRLTNLWTHLSKQKGGIGMKGPGETEIETDRRGLRNRIDILKNRLKDFEVQDKVRRNSRQGMFRVALVGYTNAGKSTLMNLLSKAGVLAENKLFATLDSTVRKVALEHPEKPGEHLILLLSDTVGFIRKLPTELIESFKSTLAEVKEADILIHVVDAGHPDFEEKIEVVNNTLKEIGADNKPILMVFNKIDLLGQYDEDFSEEDGEEKMTPEQFEKSWMASENSPAVFISATEKTNIEKLRTEITRMIVGLEHNK